MVPYKAVRSELLKEKKYHSDANSKVLNLKILNIYKKVDFDGKILIKDLNSRIKNTLDQKTILIWQI